MGDNIIQVTDGDFEAMVLGSDRPVLETLARGARGEAVLDIQTRLGSLGYPIDPSEHAWFGEATERAVRRFQERRHIIVNGLVDEHTWGELVEAGYSVGDRILYLR